MPDAAPLGAADAIAAYVRAKDFNRPHAFARAFAPDARLRMQLRTTAIAFPSEALGRDAIAETLVRRFNQVWENIVTVCIGPAPAGSPESFSCDWLVAMSAKADGGVHAGCGRYDWRFDPATGRVAELHITIAEMEPIAGGATTLLDWAGALPWPWCPRERLVEGAPSHQRLQRVLAALSNTGD